MIFAVTTLNLDVEGRRRTVGYFHKLEDAQQCAEENWGDIYEAGWYPELVIETVPEGLYPLTHDQKRYFYRWENDGYKPCDPFDIDEDTMVYCEIG